MSGLVNSIFAALYGELTPALRASIIARDGGCCQICRSATELEVDHYISRRDEGTNAPSNLRTLCGPCNRDKGGVSGEAGMSLARAGARRRSTAAIQAALLAVAKRRGG